MAPKRRKKKGKGKLSKKDQEQGKKFLLSVGVILALFVLGVFVVHSYFG